MLLTPDPREDHIFPKSLLQRLLGKFLNHVQCSNLIPYLMIFSFISTPQASQHLCKVEGVRAITVNDVLFWVVPHAKNHFISCFQSGIRSFHSKFGSTFVY